MRKNLYIFLLIFCVDAWVFAQTLYDDYRLPNSIMPVRYNISLIPYLYENINGEFTFDGTVTIEVIVKEATNKIILHSTNLEYKSRQYWSEANSTKIKLSSYEFNETTSLITYLLSDKLLPDQTYFLKFRYAGRSSEGTRGLYRTSYLDSDHNLKLIAASHFEPTRARTAFPCWDEPHFKAYFNVEITRRKNQRAFSNTVLLKSNIIDDNYVADTFDETPIMATYLNAFLVGEFDERSNGYFSVIARPDYYDQTQYSYEVGQRILGYLSDYFSINYYDMGIPKLTHVALPDFAPGAMENWGLVKYREPGLCYSNKSTSLADKEYIASVIAHEQTHMWFGNLVTCDWWSYTWLNEGFAQYFQYMATAEVEPTLKYDQTFVLSEHHSALEFDSNINTNPLNNVNMPTASVISRAFNTISYKKGASFIRMVKYVIGEENFRNSLKAYLKERQYGISQPNKLFSYWKENFPSKFKGFATDFFESFTWQEGYPLINVFVSTDKTSFEITQKRFLIDQTDGSDVSLFYTVPFTFTTDTNSDFSNTTTAFFLPPSSSTTTVTLSNPINWLVANIQEIGYYRVNYDASNWKQIRLALLSNEWSSIHELNRAQIVDDLFNLARANEISYDLALYVIEYLITETNYLPWTAAFRGFAFLYKRLGNNTDDLSAWILKLSQKAYQTLGFNETATDQPLDIFLRESILQWSCRLGLETCIETVKSYFQIITTTAVPVNLRSVVYCVAMREGSEKDYDFLVDKYKTERVATEINIILTSLGCVKHEDLIEKHFEFILSNNVRLQDKSSSLTSLYSNNNENIMPVFRLVTKNFARLADVLGSYSSVASVISGISEYFTTDTELDELRTFNNLYSAEFGAAATSLRTAEEVVRKNLDWSSRRLLSVTDYMKKQPSGSSRLNVIYIIHFILIIVIICFQ